MVLRNTLINNRHSILLELKELLIRQNKEQQKQGL